MTAWSALLLSKKRLLDSSPARPDPKQISSPGLLDRKSLGQGRPGRSNVQLVQVRAAECAARRVCDWQPDFPLQSSGWIVSSDPGASPPCAPQAAVTVDGQAVGNAFPFRDLYQYAPVCDRARGRVEIIREDDSSARIRVIHRAVVRAPGDAVRDADVRLHLLD